MSNKSQYMVDGKSLIKIHFSLTSLPKEQNLNLLCNVPGKKSRNKVDRFLTRTVTEERNRFEDSEEETRAMMT